MKISEVGFLPYTNDAGWCKDLNHLLGGIFPHPYMPNGSYGYHKARSLQLAAHSRALPWLNTKKCKGALFCSLNTDFFPDVTVMTPVKKVWGFVHMPASQSPHTSKRRLTPYEQGIYDSVDGVFVPSQVTRSLTTPKAVAVGLPVRGPEAPPNTSHRILFNQRIVPEKGADRVVKLPPPVRSRLTVSAPAKSKILDRDIAPRVDRTFVSPPRDEYMKIVRSCGYVISLARTEAFGFSVIEAVRLGLFAICPDSPTTAYREYLPEEMLFTDVREVWEMVKYYDAHPDERVELVLQAKRNLERYEPVSWTERLLEIMGVGS